jgi:hypothetical protein
MKLTCQTIGLEFATFSSNSYPGCTKEVVMECEVVTELNLARFQNGLNEIKLCTGVGMTGL